MVQAVPYFSLNVCRTALRSTSFISFRPAILNRLLRNSYVLDMKGWSYRVRDLERAVVGQQLESSAEVDVAQGRR
jgi:hypothetical protein